MLRGNSAGLAAALLARRVGALLFTLGLAACGGGFSLGINIGSALDFSPPSISIAVSPSAVRAGDSVHIVAAAADESGIDAVSFYRFDGNTAVLLGSVGSEPFEWLVTAPGDGRATLRVFARALDRAGNRADSAVVAVGVTP
jgi:Bacterial Ig domain